MLLAELICSDEACAVTVEAVGDPATLELLVCDTCGCCLQLVSVSDWRPARLRAPLELPRAA